MAMVAELGALRPVKYSAPQRHSCGFQRPNSSPGIIAMPTTIRSNDRRRLQRFYRSISAAAADAAPHSTQRSALSLTETATFAGRDEGNGHSETYLILQREPTTAVEAGRSKAKKGGLGGPGGKIERRPPRPQKVPRKPPGSAADTDEKDGSKSKQTGKGEGVTNPNQFKSQSGRAGRNRQDGDDDDDDISWLLEDRPKPSGEERKTKLVGGWGRDKSMQREVPVESVAKLRGAKDVKSIESSPGQKRTPPGKLPPVPIDDPRVRYPDKDYIEGPFGPYAWRGVCIGKPIEGDFATTQVVFFSNVADDAEKEDRQRYNYTVEYTDKVDKFDETIGVVYYYVFARSKYGPRQEPWRDWTLAAQLAVESGEELDQRLLFSRLTPNIQDITLKCVAWVRPDLIYVRKPRLQLRLEAQGKFTTQLLEILNQRDTPDSYYGKLCQILRVQTTSSSKAVKAAYEALSEEEKLKCMGHLLTQHPVKLLASARYDRIAQGIDNHNSDGTDADFAGVDLSMDISAPAENDDEDVESISGFNHDEQEAAGDLSVQGEGASREDAPQLNQSAAIERYTHKKDRYEPEPGPPVRSAVRPFNYSHLVEEIATIHNILHGADPSTEWIREAVNSR